MVDPNRERLRRAGEKLAQLGPRCVFLGGATVGLHLRQELVGHLTRPTKDVDCIVPIDSPAEWSRFEATLRAAGFRNDRKLVIRFELDGELYDFLPYGEEMSTLLGFDTTFHREAFEHATPIEVSPSCTVQVAPLEYLLATKTAAFRDRGAVDPYESKDLEDLVALFLGAPWTTALAGAPAPVREAVVSWAKEFSAGRSWELAIEAHVPGGPNQREFVKLAVAAVKQIAS